MKDKKVIILIVLVLGAVISLTRGYSKFSKGPGPSEVKEDESKNINTKKTNSSSRHTPVQNPVSGPAGENAWGRSPFTLPSTPDMGSTELKLEGVISAADGQVAVINGMVFKQGDMVGDRKIIEIKEDKVILDGNGGIFELRLQQ